MGCQVKKGRKSSIECVLASLGCAEMGSGWCVDKLHDAGLENTIVDGISRWNSEAIDGKLHALRPDVA